MQKGALLPPLLTMTTLVNLEKTSEMSRTKGKFFTSYSKQSFGIKLKKSSIKLSIEGPILLVFANSSKIFSEGLLVIAINIVQSSFYN